MKTALLKILPGVMGSPHTSAQYPKPDKNNITKGSFIGVLLLSTILFGCEDDAEQLSPENISIQFEATQQTLREGDPEPVTITLPLSKTATANGFVVFEIDSDTRERIQTTPAHTDGLLTIPFTKGATQLQFSVNIINNSAAEGDVVTTISIKSSVRLSIGEQHKLQLTIQDDDEAVVSSTAEFTDQVEAVAENSTEAVVYTIHLSAPVAIESKVEILVTSSAAAGFATSPVAEAGKITLMAPVGTTELNFTLTPLNNTEVNGHVEITFSIHSVTGSVVKGTNLSHTLIIRDDELTNKLRGYETVGRSDSEKRFYEYDSKGRIAKITWEINSGFIRSGTDTYFYDNQNRLVKINKHAGRDVHYLWNNGRIERMESYQDGTLKEYAVYAYDDHGNVAGVEPYHLQGDGSFKKGLYVVCLYLLDGNVYKSMIFQDVEGEDEPVLISTRTFENYSNNVAPVSMVEIIPAIPAQKNLPGKYRIEANGSDTTYWLTYEFNADSMPVRRTASSSNDTQTTVYHYY